MAHIDARHAAIEARVRKPLGFDRFTVRGQSIFPRNRPRWMAYFDASHATIETRVKNPRKVTPFYRVGHRLFTVADHSLEDLAKPGVRQAMRLLDFHQDTGTLQFDADSYKAGQRLLSEIYSAGE